MNVDGAGVGAGVSRRSSVFSSAVACLAVLVVLAVVGWWVSGLDARLNGAPPPAEGSPAPVGSRLRVASVGLDVPLGVMSSAGGVVDPPTALGAYVVGDHGVTPSRSGLGTVFVAMHALSGGDGPGNALVDVASHAVRVAVGEVVEVDAVEFTVVATSLPPKWSVAGDEGMWDPSVPGRLVVVTCMPPLGGGRAFENVVVIAQRSA